MYSLKGAYPGTSNDLKFVHTLARPYQFSADSFAIILDGADTARHFGHVTQQRQQQQQQHYDAEQQHHDGGAHTWKSLRWPRARHPAAFPRAHTSIHNAWLPTWPNSTACDTVRLYYSQTLTPAPNPFFSIIGMIPSHAATKTTVNLSCISGSGALIKKVLHFISE